MLLNPTCQILPKHLFKYLDLRPPPDDGAGAAVEPVQTETHSFVLSPPGKKSSKFYVQEMMSLNGEEDTEAANFANFEAAEPIEAGSSWHHTQAEDIPSFDYVEVSAEDTTHGRGADWKVPIGVGPHADYDIKEKELYTVFRLRAFSWEDQGYATLHRYFPDLAELFDMKFNTTRDLTYEYMGDESGVDTFVPSFSLSKAASGTVGAKRCFILR